MTPLSNPAVEVPARIGSVVTSSFRREPAVLVGAAILLVLLRSFLPTYYEGFYFDSDQAIVGLMARHLSRFEDFPLYYYGLNYLLGVQAWIIAPFFWLFRSSVAVMRLPLILLNIGVVVTVMAGLRTNMKISPRLAFIAALPLIIPTPATGTHLLETAGACIEPFVYILLLWRLRLRPVAFGMLLAFGSFHREFTLFALPAIILIEAASGELWTRRNVRRATLMAGGFGLVWLIVDDIKMHLLGTPLALQAVSLQNQISIDGDWASRVAALVQQALPALFGGVRTELLRVRINSTLETGSALAGLLAGFALLLMVLRLLQRGRQFRLASPDSGFGLYLLGIGTLTACAYPFSANVIFGYPPLLRYLLFALLIPVGLFACFVALEPSRRWRALVSSLFVLWAGFNLVDYGRLILAAAQNPPTSEHRILTDYLLEHNLRYATATYWDAYVVDFLSRERVTVASNDAIRIPRYQTEVEENAKAAVNLKRQPCEGDDRVASWCVQR